MISKLSRKSVIQQTCNNAAKSSPFFAVAYILFKNKLGGSRIIPLSPLLMTSLYMEEVREPGRLKILRADFPHRYPITAFFGGKKCMALYKNPV